MSANIKKDAIRNVSITVLCQILYVVVSFVCRTVFTKILGAEYLGINGLFSNVLTILSFVELGIGSSIVYKLYKPLSENNEHAICVYLYFYKKIYNVIILLVLVLGILLIPFLDFLVTIPDVDINITLLYLLFLADTIISYVYVYKKSLLIADQKNYIVEIYTQVFNIFINIIQIIALYITHRFVLYLTIKIFGDLLCNVALSCKVNRNYPFARKIIKERIPEKDEIEFKRNIKGLLLGKIASVSFDGTDNIFIALFSGVSTVGIISNYTMILTHVNIIMNKVFYSLTASVGKLSIESNSKHVGSVFSKIYFANTMIYGYMFVGMTVLLRMLVTELWLDETFYLSVFTVELIIIEVCLRGISYPLYMTRTAYGYFYQLQWISVISAVLNIILDFVLGKMYGVSGIMLATIISRSIIRGVDAYIVYSECLKKKVRNYYLTYFRYMFYIVILTIAAYIFGGFIRFNNILLEFVVRFLFITIMYLCISILVFRRSEEYRYYKGIFINGIQKRLKKDG